MPGVVLGQVVCVFGKINQLLFCDMLFKGCKAQVQAVRSFTGSETHKEGEDMEKWLSRFSPVER